MEGREAARWLSCVGVKGRGAAWFCVGAVRDCAGGGQDDGGVLWLS